jgi:hypothetical protein
MPDLLLDLADAARKSGLKVVELDGWRSNYSAGAFNPDGSLDHHTGSYDEIGDTSSDLAYAKWLAFTGRPDLGPPLCNLTLSAECVVYVCAAGNANHAGKARASGPMPAASDGNAIYVGIEAMNSGSQGWESVGRDAFGNEVTQGEALARLDAALARHYGWAPTHVRGHKETSTTGKWDPGLLDMNKHRDRVEHYMNAAAEPKDKGWWLWVVCVNWGRHYDPGEFTRNVWNVMRLVEGKGHVALLVQELDEEPDRADEHKQLLKALEPGSTKVAWRKREPIILSPKFTVRRQRAVMTMGAGGDIGAPKGTGPARFSVTCIGSDEGLDVGFGNTHSHRNDANRAVQKARREGARIFKTQLNSLYEARGGTSVVYGADPNDRHFPEMIDGERTAIKRGGAGDFIRYKSHPNGARLQLRKTGHLEGTIDPHDPIWALFRVTERGGR